MGGFLKLIIGGIVAVLGVGWLRRKLAPTPADVSAALDASGAAADAPPVDTGGDGSGVEASGDASQVADVPPPDATAADATPDQTAAGDTTPPDAVTPTPPPSSPDEVADRVIAWTVKNEAGGVKNPYAAVNRNGDGSGLSFGFIQFAQRVGSLGEFLRALFNADSMKFSMLFGADYQNLLDVTTDKTVPAPIARGPNAPPGVGTMALALWQEPWVTTFKQAGADPLVQQVERSEAKRRYYDPMKKLADVYNVQTPRGLTMLFDTSVQQGVGGLTAILKDAALTYGQDKVQDGDELAFLQLVAVAAESRGGTWSADVTRRRQAILASTDLSDVPIV